MILGRVVIAVSLTSVVVGRTQETALLALVFGGIFGIEYNKTADFCADLYQPSDNYHTPTSMRPAWIIGKS